LPALSPKSIAADEEVGAPASRTSPLSLAKDTSFLVRDTSFLAKETFFLAKEIFFLVKDTSFPATWVVPEMSVVLDDHHLTS
jgi:hypothetical protein